MDLNTHHHQRKITLLTDHHTKLHHTHPDQLTLHHMHHHMLQLHTQHQRHTLLNPTTNQTHTISVMKLMMVMEPKLTNKKKVMTMETKRDLTVTPMLTDFTVK